MLLVVFLLYSLVSEGHGRISISNESLLFSNLTNLPILFNIKKK